jgi:hypothetical protein
MLDDLNQDQQNIHSLFAEISSAIDQLVKILMWIFSVDRGSPCRYACSANFFLITTINWPSCFFKVSTSALSSIV